ncbi:hypothetical protein K3495_g7603 [Podosphaera aphanis]|nr:hypothetical protein K3495_g7603 [Podosphaera aphanis]
MAKTNAIRDDKGLMEAVTTLKSLEANINSSVIPSPAIVNVAQQNGGFNNSGHKGEEDEVVVEVEAEAVTLTAIKIFKRDMVDVSIVEKGGIGRETSFLKAAIP